jgi:uncharacterized protein
VILEGIVTSRHEAGEWNISPMGPEVDESLDRLWLRPFATSRTARNLAREGVGVFHVTDNVELLARAAIDCWDEHPALRPLEHLPVQVLAEACRWYAFRVESLDTSAERWRMECRVVERGWQRDFLGFNRAKHAVLEAAILATRIHLLSRPDIEQQLTNLKTLVNKTAGPQEERAFALLETYFQETWQQLESP